MGMLPFEVICLFAVGKTSVPAVLLLLPAELYLLSESKAFLIADFFGHQFLQLSVYHCYKLPLKSFTFACKLRLCSSRLLRNLL